MQNAARLAQSALRALEAALGPLPLSAADISPDVIESLAADIRPADPTSVPTPALPGTPTDIPRLDTPTDASAYEIATGADEDVDAPFELVSCPADGVVGMAGANGDANEAVHMDDTHESHACVPASARPSVTWLDNVDEQHGRELAEGSDLEDVDTTGRERAHSSGTEEWEQEAVRMAEEVSLARGPSATPRLEPGGRGGGQRVKYATSFEFVDAATVGAQRGGVTGGAGAGAGVAAAVAVVREPLDQRMRRHREELRHVAAMAAAAAASKAGKGSAGGDPYGVGFDAAMRALVAAGRAAAGRRVKEEGIRGSAPGKPAWAVSGWVAGAARGAEAEGLEMVQHAPGCPAMPWKLVHPVCTCGHCHLTCVALWKHAGGWVVLRDSTVTHRANCTVGQSVVYKAITMDTVCSCV